MPQIAFSEPEVAAGELMWLMMYPDDEIKRERTTTVSIVDRLTRDADASDLTLPVSVVRDLIDSPSSADMRKEQRTRSSNGLLTGQILVAIYMMDRLALSPSMNKALYAVSKYAKTTTYGDGSAVPTSEPTLRQCWAQFAPVAPLWAAYCLIGEPIEQNDFAMFLGVAAALRAFAVSFVPKRARPPVPILDPKSTWEMPEGVKPILLIPDNFRTPLVKFLSGYKAPASNAYRRTTG